MIMSNTTPFKNGEVFGTTNTALAAALVTAGVPFADPRRPFENIYTEARLEEIGAKSIREALEARKPGKITYAFRVTPGLKKLVEAFGEASEFIRLTAEGVDVTPREVDVSPEDVVRVACQYNGNRSWFAENWFRQVPLAHIVTGEKSCVIVSRNATPATRRRLGLE